MEFPNIVETKRKGEKMYLISAYFDEHTTRQLQRFIDAVAQNTGRCGAAGGAPQDRGEHGAVQRALGVEAVAADAIHEALLRHCADIGLRHRP